MGRFHTNWLNMMLPRLRLAANLLRDDGVIFISIDDTEQANLRKLCDEVFGEENFLASCIWQKRTSPDARKVLSEGHEYLILYCRNNVYLSEAISVLPLSESDKASYKNPDNDPRGPWVSSDFTAQGYRPNQMYTITTPGGKEYTPPEGTCWKNIEEGYLKQVGEGRFWFGKDGNGIPRRKTYLFEKEGRNLWTWWPNTEVGHTQEATQEHKALFGISASIFDFPKPVRLVQRAIAFTTKENDIILDFFSGSATTAHAAMQLNAEDGGNRRFILVQLPEVCDENSEAAKAGYTTICDIGKERVRRAGRELIESDMQLTLGESTKPLDVGFRVFKLSSSNLKQWDSSPLTSENAVMAFEQRLLGMLDILKPNRSDVDVVYEVMLKLGQDLCEPIRSIELPNGRQVYGVGADMKFIVCLAPNITVEDAAIMSDYAPGRIIFADACFDNSEQKSNVRLTLKDKDIAIKTL